MVQIAVCEDARSERTGLNDMLVEYQGKHPYLLMQTMLFESAEALLDARRNGERFDVYLLDIIMPGMDGIALARTLRREDKDSAIIMVTSSRDYAVEAFSVRAVDYLLKPVTPQALFGAMDDALARIGPRAESYVTIPMSQADRLVKRSDILCVEVTGHSLCYTLADGQRLHSKVLRIPFEQAAAPLMEDPRFIRPHRSYLVNAGYIARLTSTEFIMDTGLRVPISRLRYTQVKDAYMQFLNRAGGAGKGGVPSVD